MGFFDNHLEELDKDEEILDDEKDNYSYLDDDENNKTNDKEKKKSIFSFFKKKQKKQEYLTDDDIAGKRKKIINKTVVVITIIGFILILIFALYITMQKNNARRAYIKAHPPKKEKSIQLVTNSDNLWKLQVDNQLKNLRERINNKFEEIKKIVEKENNLTIQAVNNIVEKKFTKKLEKIDDKIKSIQEKTSNIKELIKTSNQEVLKKSKIYALKKSLELQQKLSKLNPVSVSIQQNNNSSNKIKPSKENLALIKENEKNKEKIKKMKAALAAAKKRKQKVKEIEEEVSNLDIQNIPVDEEVQSKLKTKVKKKENVSYHLMTGFTTATLITGVSAPTFSAGLINPKPILLSVNGRAIIANDQQENIQDCLLIGKATGNMNTSRAEILITRISCSIPTDKPNIYKKIEATGNPIGWVIGEDGKYGLRGRLVDSAGKLIMRQIMVGFLQGVSQAFAPSSIIPTTTTNTSPIKNVNNALATGGATGMSNAFSSLAEYYKKMLDGMYPYIDVMGGRKVTVLLKGFQDIKITKYKKVDISSIQNNNNEEVDYEVKIDYNDF